MSDYYSKYAIDGEKHIRFSSNTEFTSTNNLLNGFALTQIGYYPKAIGHYVERLHGRDEYVYLLCTEGSGYVEFNHHIYHMTKNSLISIPINTSHRYYSDDKDPWSIIWMHFKCNTELFNTYHSHTSLFQTNLSQDRIESIHEYFQQTFDIASHDIDDSSTILLSNYLQLILCMSYLRPNKLKVSDSNDSINKCINYIENNYSKIISLELLGEISNLSTSYLSALFKRTMGISPIEYLIQYRIEKACYLLRTSNLKVYEIAIDVGYENPLYFSKLFKQHTGLSPKQYRASMV